VIRDPVGAATLVFLLAMVAMAHGARWVLAGYHGGTTDRVITRISDAVQSLPSLILILAVVAVFGTGVVPAMTTLGIILAPMILRVVRAATVDVREESFVDAARVVGLGNSIIIRRHLLPHVLPPFIIQASLVLGIGLLVEAGLSFIGLGVQPPTPSWGAMLARATTYLAHAPNLVFPAGIVITATVLALNLLGDVIRDKVGRGVDSAARRHRRGTGPATAAAAAPAAVELVAAPAQGRDLLVVRDLSIAFPDRSAGAVDVVTGVSFGVGRGEVVGLVGESGCGKSVTARALLGLVPAPGWVTGGSIQLGGEELVGRSGRWLRQVRGNRVALIFQDPMSSLDPAFTVGDQVAEAVRTHRRVSRAEARRRAVDLLDQVGIPDPGRRVRAYPHEFSGGMAQRVMIAVALAGDPDLLVADEPTTSLDVTVQTEILDLLRSLQASRGMSILFVTHDLGVVADLCDRVLIMYAGQIVEAATAIDLFHRPHHPYTAALLASVLRNEPRSGRLEAIAGSVPPPHAWPAGCRFAPRCPYAIDDCLAAPVPLASTDTGWARCLRADELTTQLARGSR
jgi:peptide/nickel transport system permease protein